MIPNKWVSFRPGGNSAYRYVPIAAPSLLAGYRRAIGPEVK